MSTGFTVPILILFLIAVVYTIFLICALTHDRKLIKFADYYTIYTFYIFINNTINNFVMTRKEVRDYLRTYCDIDLKEEYCTLENVLNLIPDVQNSKQSKAFSLNVPINEHCFDSLAESNWLSGDLIISRNDDGIWTLDCDWDGIVGVLSPEQRPYDCRTLYV